METEKLRSLLLNKINTVQDKTILEQLYAVIYNNKTDHYQLTEDELKMVNEGMEQYQSGEIISHEEVKNESKKWLDE